MKYQCQDRPDRQYLVRLRQDSLGVDDAGSRNTIKLINKNA